MSLWASIKTQGMSLGGLIRTQGVSPGDQVCFYKNTMNESGWASIRINIKSDWRPGGQVGFYKNIKNK